jgi:CBS domain-containing protein
MRTNVNELYELIQKIDTSETLSELSTYHHELAYRLRELMNQDMVFTLSHAVCDVHDALVKKALAFAEEATVRAAVGTPPTKWCWYVMGSIGRGEPTVWTDQDNGILFECPPEKEADCYEFVRYLASVGTSYLHEIGYPYCSGNVMATNHRWSKSLRDWEKQIDMYIHHHLPDDIRFLFIAMDMRPIYGTSDLIIDSKQTLIRHIYDHPLLLKRMGEHVMFPRVPLGWFGNFQIERWGRYSGYIHLKHSGYVQLVNSLKFLSCVGNISAMTTWERLNHICTQLLLPPSLASKVEEALLTCVYFRLKYSMETGSDRDYVPLHVLDKNERFQLKKAMNVAKTLQRFVVRQAGGLRDE